MMKRLLFLGLALLLAAAPGAFAQISTGNIYGKVTDESGAVLPGAVVTLGGELGARSTTVGSQGDFRFLNLDKGRYTVTVNMAGFGTVNRQLNVTTGENVTVDFALKVAQIAEAVTVTGEASLVDIKKRGTSTTMTTEELQSVPNARDPWGVLKSVPGVLLDRINIAGNENGQQASVAGKGSTTGDKIWTLDGVNVTDMAATGASPTYFDFEAFSEINVTTGGGDLNVQTGGIGINLVTKRGTNKFHGGGRFLITDEDLSSSNMRDDITNDPRQTQATRDAEFGDHIKNLKDFGFEIGGPIVKDKLWFYATYGKQDIKLIRLNQTPDDTLLPAYNAKLNWQATSGTMVSAYYFLGNKQKFGRQPSQWPVQPTDDYLWNQANEYTDGGLPGGLWKMQVDHTFSPNFFISAKAAYYDTGFGLIARGGPEKSYTVDYVAGTGIGSYSDYLSIRPLKLGSLDGSYFFGAGGGNNELKFGFSYRDLSTYSTSAYNGNQLVGIYNSTNDPTGAENYAWLVRNRVVEYGGKYVSAHLGDVFTKDRFTFNIGARWDLQTAKNLASSAPANASFPERMPALEFGGDAENKIEWSDISPRLGLSYALNESRKTIVRASFARYAGQLSYGDVSEENPGALSVFAYGWRDTNNDRFVQPNEMDFNNFLYSFGADPANPGAVGSTVNQIDRDYKAKHDNEFIVGIDHELGANFAVGAAYTYRTATDWAYRPRMRTACNGEPTQATCTVVQPSEYTQLAPVTASGYTVTPFSISGASRRFRTNRDGYSTSFNGIELTAVKRLSNKWMARAAFSFNDWTEGWDGNVTPTQFNGNPTPVETDPLNEGGQVANLSGGSGKASFYTSVKWQFYGNVLVQLPWTMDASAAVFGRQGGPYPVHISRSIGSDGTMRMLATPEVDTDRYDNIWDIDLRLAKNIRLGKEGALTLSAELFNTLNNDVILSLNRTAGVNLGRVEEIIAPRTLRLGARLSF
jgi:hypothetical protein